MNTTLRRLGLSAWRSPALMSWGSLGVRVIGFVLVLPLALRHLPVEEIAVWFLFLSLIALQGLADFGFAPTFVRAVAYARAGREAGAERVDAVIRTMRYVYVRLALASLALISVVGGVALWGPISQVREPAQAWSAAALMALGGAFGIRAAMFAVYLQGAERIAAFRRREIVAGLAMVAASSLVLVSGGGLLGLSCVSLAGALAGSALNRALAVRLSPPGTWAAAASPDMEVMRSVWPPAWRSGLGVLMTFGAIQGSGVVFAQLAPPIEVASYLLAQRLMQALSEFASVPFYTRLPGLARMFAEARSAELLTDAGRGMLRANWLLVAGIVGLGSIGVPLLALIGSRTPFAAADLWWLLGTAVLVERIGAMHLQLYSTTNRIVWHIANGVAGILMICAMPFAYRSFGVLGLPLGMLIGYAAFYAPFSMACSYRAFRLNPAQIDLAASAAPLAVVVAGLLAALRT
ncbi:MAG: hypothetical protein A2V91_00650 [Candidatus Muproteobacteria bacterium RBG_16_64_10]|uniref:Polysaccharide biosynthesis protein n=1 Tax=Candidatus Muproteobacteria bacterium RBG_16_64_10 TaxID=1817757 RepID=A0A1F6T6U3_9PROT|nr:MAG: hypothetical protein A2V91_00650 [Candidatus Muproteobacteria bacterium RBG_16_64_10]